MCLYMDAGNAPDLMYRCRGGDFMKLLNNKVESLAWILSLLVAYSIIGYYVNFLLGTYGDGYMSHVLALFAVLILAYGIFTGRKVRK